MSLETTPEVVNTALAPDWVPEPPPTDLIFDDGEPLESDRHRVGMNVLIRSMLTARAGDSSYFAGGNMFVYYNLEQLRNQDFRGPDFFVVLNVDGTKERQGWVSWQENGRYPDVIVELLSPSTAKKDFGEKKEIYEQVFRTSDYFVYDPFNPDSLQGWHLDIDQGYQDLQPNEKGWLWCQKLELWLGNWQGEAQGKFANWLRFYDRAGNLVLLPEEAAEQAQQQAEQAQQQAEQAQLDAIPKLREMGLTAEQVAQALNLPIAEVERYF
ncbi:Uma2 family endonuclease [Lusitaniella coriacea LEGE 07157]|uniref:Uma2 family endonuclease n=1 Tax=Lusitaniella coriacea LEGE 07157 TaxID=945747 RepID=A0A8J7B7C6_9CYAN|nr:Uma2 family endonuclease [Lusitaniella coriacea]MBE9115294.1 Uma2 family endonuclease [Lusitaniella coriacea LEGE 07157]